jgi:PPK2 family polyphosphate:nucleotide phosphotransferase
MATKLKDKKSAKAVEKSFAKAARKAAKKSGVKGTKVGKGPVESAVEPFAQAFAVAQELRFKPGRPLSEIDPGSTPGFTGSSDDAVADQEATAPLLSELQERFWASSRSGDPRSVLLVLQGMDTSGKGGIVRHVLGSVDPQGVSLCAFKAPTAEERAHDFLWRVRRQLPEPGSIGVFDRSHYEDVLIVRVHDLVPRATWSRRYASINRFEAGLAAKGTSIAKIFLHISKEKQAERLAERLARPDKYWKYNPGDVDERAHWDHYAEAYQATLERCDTEVAPWFVVPANHKWYARWAVQNILLHMLQQLDPRWPPADFDIESEKARLAAS